MARTLTFILVLLMSLVLLVFTASRTLDLLQTFLPAGQQSAFAYLGLVAFDGGLVGWSLFFAYGARGQYQRAIALLMVIVSLAAVGISTIADLYLGASAKGLLTSLSEGQRLAVLLICGGVIVANIVAFFLVHITEPERLRAMAVENANDQIQAETLRQIGKVAPMVAAQVAPQLTREWVIQTIQTLAPGAQPVLPVPSVPTVEAAPLAHPTPAPAPAPLVASVPAQPTAPTGAASFHLLKPGTWFPAQQAAASAQPPAPAPHLPTAEQIRALVDALAAQGVHVEIKQAAPLLAAMPEVQAKGSEGASNGSPPFQP